MSYLKKKYLEFRIYRIFEILVSLTILIIFSLFFLIITFLIKYKDKGTILHWSKRIGLNNKIFYMPKFRTMSYNTPNLATHLLKNPDDYITPVGKFLRKTSLDELPQLYSILLGDMTFVGPRPALFNQYDLIRERSKLGIQMLKPGITGYAQINGRDDISIKKKIEYDYFYLNNKSTIFDLKIIILTFTSIIKRKNISH
tara:strand:+ start:75 stop:671 length:597 start_codon:yes stop_codon:yes gene_type:complete